MSDLFESGNGAVGAEPAAPSFRFPHFAATCTVPSAAFNQ